MMKANNKKILGIMLVCSLVALGFGLYVMKSRTSPLPAQEQSNTQDTKSNEVTPQPEVPTQDAVIPTDWKVYTNAKHGFTVLYPPYLKAGSVSDNSVLGTFQVPVRGLHLGPLLLVALKDADIKKQAQELFKGVYDAAKNPQPTAGAELAPVECKIDIDSGAGRKGVEGLQAVSCNGEGGAARYAYIKGTNFDVFVDGYSKGYDNQNNGELTSTKDYLMILNTFTFGDEFKDWNSNPTSTTPDTTTTSPAPPGSEQTATPTIQMFTVNADDSTATPTEITVTKGNIVQITFVIGPNTYYGGLDFKSSVVNSGTINAGQSKTISFKANESFQFTPYWPSSNVAKGYKISVTVQ